VKFFLQEFHEFLELERTSQEEEMRQEWHTSELLNFVAEDDNIILEKKTKH
jgi:hypothetical protein